MFQAEERQGSVEERLQQMESQVEEKEAELNRVSTRDNEINFFVILKGSPIQSFQAYINLPYILKVMAIIRVEQINWWNNQVCIWWHLI